MRTTQLLVLLFVAAQSIAQTIPLDPEVKVGMLDNGFTYYIRKGEKQDNKVTIYFVVKAGRNQEDKDQLELSHLLEHMPFTGTVNFPDVFDHFSALGIQRGVQLNAYTAYDRTVYSLIDIPADMNVVGDGFTFFRDCAHGMLLDTARVDRARPSVVEEGRSSMGLRAIDTYIDKLIGNPGYKSRTATESIENIRKFDHGAIVRYYEEWYRPNLQGIIITGDLDEAKIESLVRTTFSDLKNPAGMREVKDFPPFEWKNQCFAVVDAKRKISTVEVYLKFPYPDAKTTADFKRIAMFELFDQLLENRFSEIANKEPATIFHSSYYRPLPGSPPPLAVLSIHAEARDTEVKDVLKSAILELNRAKQHGFVNTELAEAKKQLLERKIRKPSFTLYFNYSISSQIAKELLDHLVTGEVSPSYEQWKSILDDVEIGEMNDFATKELLLNRNNRDVVIMAPEATMLPTEDSMFNWLAEAEAMTTRPYEPHELLDVAEEASDRPIMSSKEVRKLVRIQYRKEKVDDLGVTKLTLPNGITVFLKPVKDDEGNEIHMEGFRPGGFDDYKEEDHFSAVWSAALIRRSSLASYSKAELDNFTASKGINVRPRINAQYSVFQGTFNTANIEAGLQLLYQYMTKPTKEKKAFDELLRVLRKNRTEKLENLSKIDFDRAYEIYRSQFGATTDFTFVLSGNFEVKEMIPLVAKYLGNVPANGADSKTSSIPYGDPVDIKFQSRVDTVRSGYSGKVKMHYSGKYTYSNERDIRLNILTDALTNVLRKRLREKEGGTYNAGVVLDYNKLTGEYHFLVSFECDPDRMKEMILYTREEIEKLKLQGVDPQTLESVVSFEVLSHRRNLAEADFWVRYLVEQIQNNMDIGAVTKKEGILLSLSNEDIKETARECFRDF